MVSDSVGCVLDETEADGLERMIGGVTGTVCEPSGPEMVMKRCAEGEASGRDGEMDEEGRVTVTEGGMGIGNEPICDCRTALVCSGREACRSPRASRRACRADDSILLDEIKYYSLLSLNRSSLLVLDISGENRGNVPRLFARQLSSPRWPLSIEFEVNDILTIDNGVQNGQEEAHSSICEWMASLSQYSG